VARGDLVEEAAEGQGTDAGLGVGGRSREGGHVLVRLGADGFGTTGSDGGARDD
jgi:hypothetical protein